MKAITLYQPWASLVACGAKTFETRSWSTVHRGKLAIHAGKKKPSDVLCGVDVDIIVQMGLALGFAKQPESANVNDIVARMDKLPLGAIVAITELVGCHSISSKTLGGESQLLTSRNGRHDFEEINEAERMFGDFRKGRFAWELANVQKLGAQISARGSQRLWNWD